MPTLTLASGRISGLALALGERETATNGHDTLTLQASGGSYVVALENVFGDVLEWHTFNKAKQARAAFDALARRHRMELRS